MSSPISVTSLISDLQAILTLTRFSKTLKAVLIQMRCCGFIQVEKKTSFISSTVAKKTKPELFIILPTSQEEKDSIQCITESNNTHRERERERERNRIIVLRHKT